MEVWNRKGKEVSYLLWFVGIVFIILIALTAYGINGMNEDLEGVEWCCYDRDVEKI